MNVATSGGGDIGRPLRVSVVLLRVTTFVLENGLELGQNKIALMSSLAYIMQWGDHKSSVQKHLRLLFQEQKFVDVTLFCGTHSVRVHSVVVASNSSYFERVLLSQSGANSVIVLKDMKFEVLKALIEFMYSGETTILDEDVDALLYASKKFEVKGLCKMTRQDVMFFAEKNENKDLACDQMSSFPAEPAGAGMIQAVADMSHKEISNKATKLDQECARMENLYFEKTVFRRRGRPFKARGSISLPETALSDTEYAILKEAEESRRALEKLQKYVSHSGNNQKHGAHGINNLNQNPLLKKLKIAANSQQKSNVRAEALCSGQHDLTEDEIAARNLTNELNKQDRDHILESAGFPTDLPIFVDDGKGNYVNLDVEMAEKITGQQLKYHLVQGIVMTNADDKGSLHSNPANVLVPENCVKCVGLSTYDDDYRKEERKHNQTEMRDATEVTVADFEQLPFSGNDEPAPNVAFDFGKSKIERKPFVVKEIIRINQPRRKLISNLKNSVQVVDLESTAVNHS